MATSTDEILVKFTTEGGQEVVKTFKEVSDQSDQFHQKVSKAGGALGDLRLKSEGRVANNVGAIAQALTGGASAGEVFATAITKVSESFRGSLLFAGAATVGFALYEGITKAGEAAIKLDTDIANLRRSSLGTGDFLGTDQINKNLDATVSKIDELRSRFARERTGVGGEFNQALRGVLELQTRPQLEARDLEQANELRATGLRILDQTAEKQLSINDITRETLVGDEKEAALLQIQADHRERAARIAELEARLGIQGTSTAQNAEESRTDLATALVEKKFSIQQRGLETQAKTIDIEKALLAPADENLKILDARIAGVQDLLEHQHNLTLQEREQLILQRGQLEATKERAQFTRQLEQDLAGIELGRVRGNVGSDRSRINSAQRNADQARVFGENSPEFERAEAGLEDEQFRQYEDYQKNPSAFRQRRINEQFERGRFEWARAHGQLPSEIASRPSDLNMAAADQQNEQKQDDFWKKPHPGSDITNKLLHEILKLHQGFAKKVDVG